MSKKVETLKANGACDVMNFSPEDGGTCSSKKLVSPNKPTGVTTQMTPGHLQCPENIKSQ
jgi:hypothetical protein